MWTLLLVLAAAQQPSLPPFEADCQNFCPSVRTASPSTPAPMVTLDAMPYTRTVTCSGSITITGTSTDATSVAWDADPDGASGSCTGTDSFSCTVSVSPNAAGEGVETITVTASGAGGDGADTVDVGFYVVADRGCYLSQSVDGSYNSTKANNDAVATWVDVSSYAKNLAQGSGSAQPTFKTSIVNGQPVVRCDGGDRVSASTASDWTFLNNGSDFTASYVFATTSSNPNAIQTIATTAASVGASASRGVSLFHDDRAAVPREDRALFTISSGSALQISVISADDAAPAAVFDLIQAVLDDDGGVGDDGFQFCNGSACGVAARSGSYSASDPVGPLTICAETDAGNPLTGDMFRFVVYSTALSSTQRGINQAVDEWALGGTLPVTP